ncbi:uncharacterized protein LOC143239801 isoform X2 [Tachypleus tridentatus]|uniref:uncharacterized protein LOC143239801 isoform X2 n=1 Tax=Tachypleus tridentatus TaxID=6853 RepID=UPI003FD54622
MSKKPVSQSIMSKFSTMKFYLRTLAISTSPSFYCTEQCFLPKRGWTWAQYKCWLQWATGLWQWMYVVGVLFITNLTLQHLEVSVTARGHTYQTEASSLTT